MRYAFVAAFVVGLVALSLVADRGATEQRMVTGTVSEWRAGEFIAVVNERTDPEGIRIGLRNTVYDGDTGLLKSGVRVTVWYRFVGERLPVADRVRVLSVVTH
jgi:hypothetical protein